MSTLPPFHRAPSRRLPPPLLLAIALWWPAVTAPAQERERPAPRERVVVVDSVSVIDVDAKRVTAMRRIVIRGDSIVAVESVSAMPPDSVDEYVNARAAFAIPGLVDHHVHLVQGMAAALERGARGGVTMVQAMAGDNRVAGEYARASRAKEIVAPEIAYASVMAGPDFFADPRFIGASDGFPVGKAPWAQAVTAETDIPTAVAAARGSGAEVLKLYAMIDSALAARLTAEAHRQGMRVVAHGTVFPARPLQLVAAGVDVLTHAPYLSWQGAAEVRPEDSWKRRDGPYATVRADGPELTAVLAAMKAHGTYLEPTLWVFSRPDVPPAVARWGAQLTVRAQAVGVPILAGTDGFVERDTTALPVIHRELQRLVEAGLTPAAALAAATTIPAREMRRARTHGAVAPGRVADIVLLDANPLGDIRNTTRIRAVVLRGRVLAR